MEGEGSTSSLKLMEMERVEYGRAGPASQAKSPDRFNDESTQPPVQLSVHSHHYIFVTKQIATRLSSIAPRQ
jgi:hypothetical protein